MDRVLAVSIGRCSDPGSKELNQDFHGAVVPEGPELSLKGVALAVADGISTSPVSHVAAETAVKSFLSDYYCTSDAWSVRTAGSSIIAAANAWLHGETRRSQNAYDLDRGYVCTFTALVLKGRAAHLFHVGDSRACRVSGESLEPLTNDHRVVMSSTESYLGRAMGMADSIEIDYATHAILPGDIFVLSTDGAHEYVDARDMAALIRANTDLDRAARLIADRALENGSNDNITVQIVRVDAVPDGDAVNFIGQVESLPPPPALQPPAELDGYQLLREIHANERSHIYLAVDGDSDVRVALKVPAVSLRAEPRLLRQFMMEEWIARRVSSPHLVRAHVSPRQRSHLFVVMEYVEGQTLRQWMHDHPQPSLEAMRDIIEQIIKGLRALHRKEMVHCDLRPENIVIDTAGTVKLLDFGSVRVAGLVEAATDPACNAVLGTVQYTAPEWLAGDLPTWRSDLFSAAVIAYEMLTGRLPYGARAGRVQSPTEQRALRYDSARSRGRGIPDWIDGALRTALHPDPWKRHDAMSEFMNDLRVPNPRFQLGRHAPLLERDPVLFWKGLSLILAIALIAVLITVNA